MFNEIRQLATSGVDHTCESNSETGLLLASAVGGRAWGLEDRLEVNRPGRWTEERPGAWEFTCHPTAGAAEGNGQNRPRDEKGRSCSHNSSRTAPTIQAGLPGENDRQLV